MGYTTNFNGCLKFKKEISIKELIRIQQILGEEIDKKDAAEFKTDNHFIYVDLSINTDYDGIEWDGSEKSYYFEEQVNFVIQYMRKEFPDFGLTGEIMAQGEEIGDVWKLYIGDDGFAHKKELKVDGLVECPDCGHKFKI